MKWGTSLTILIILVSGLSGFNSSMADQKPLYNFKIIRPFSWVETAEIINADTPDEVTLVKGNRSVIYISSNNGRDYGVNEFTQYVADQNGNRVKSRFRLRLLDQSSPRLGITSLISTVGFALENDEKTKQPIDINDII